MSKILLDNYWPFDGARFIKADILGDINPSFLMRCDYCRRIIVKTSTNSAPCTACGHGHLGEMRPRNWCCLCGEPQYDNVSKSPIRVECDKCVGGRVDGIHQLETLLKTQFINTEDAKRKCERSVLSKGKVSKGDMRIAREAKGWSQGELGIHLGVSQSAIAHMESGRRPYGEKAHKWLKDYYKAMLPYAEADFGNEISIDSKQVKGGPRGHQRQGIDKEE